MMKWYRISFLLLFLTNALLAQETIRIPDVALEEALIDLKIDTNGLNGTILVSDARYVVNLNVSDPINNNDLPNVHSKIKDLAGIEHFENLKRLDCYGNELKTIDLSKNTKLTFLNCSENKISELDLSNNSELYFISCDSNKLTSLKLGYKPKLTELYCSGNRLTELNLKSCPALETIDISDNKINEVLISSTAASAIPERWYKDAQTIFVTTRSKPTTLNDTSKTTQDSTTTTVKKPARVENTQEKVYNEEFKKMVVKEFEKNVLHESYLKEKRQEIQLKYKLDAGKLSKWIEQYSELMKVRK